MIAATQADITALGWYYIPVVMMSATLAIAVGLITNNIQRRYPVFWVSAGKIPSRQKETQVDAQTAPTQDPNEPPRPSDISHKLSVENNYCVTVTRSEVLLPGFLDLENEHKQVLEEIQRMLNEHASESPSHSTVAKMV